MGTDPNGAKTRNFLREAFLEKPLFIGVKLWLKKLRGVLKKAKFVAFRSVYDFLRVLRGEIHPVKQEFWSDSDCLSRCSFSVYHEGHEEHEGLQGEIEDSSQSPLPSFCPDEKARGAKSA